MNSESAENNKIDAGETVAPVLSDSAGYLLNKAAHVIREMVTEKLRPLGLAPRDLGVLKIINEAATNQQHLSKIQGIDRTTMVQIIDDLEKRGLVLRGENPHDRRSYLLSLTVKGRRTLSQAAKLARKEQEKFLAPLNEGEWDVLRQILVKLVNYHG